MRPMVQKGRMMNSVCWFGNVCWPFQSYLNAAHEIIQNLTATQKLLIQ